MGLWKIVQTGGVTIYVLIICSIVSIAIIFERFLYYKREARVNRVKFMQFIIDALKKRNTERAIELCKQSDTAVAKVVSVGIMTSALDEQVVANAMEREIVIQTTSLERFTSIVGTIGSIAVYIGLFGTVLGIIKAFHEIARSGAGGINVVINGISEALICTAAGLCVAIPAVIAYNYCMKKVDRVVTDMELCASELKDQYKSGHR